LDRAGLKTAGSPDRRFMMSIEGSEILSPPRTVTHDEVWGLSELEYPAVEDEALRRAYHKGYLDCTKHQGIKSVTYDELHKMNPFTNLPGVHGEGYAFEEGFYVACGRLPPTVWDCTPGYLKFFSRVYRIYSKLRLKVRIWLRKAEIV
jgi:hypothetical protein